MIRHNLDGTRPGGRRLEWLVTAALAAAIVGGVVTFVACARMPYTTTVVHKDPRVIVKLQREVESVVYSHPVSLSPAQVAAILKGFSLREQVGLPLRWFAEENPPRPVFTEHQIHTLAPLLAHALEKASPSERIVFSLLAPGKNRDFNDEVTGGWIAVHDPFLFIRIEYFHDQISSTTADPAQEYGTDPYLYGYLDNVQKPPKSYLLYFEPGRFQVTDRKVKVPAIDFREFLKFARVP